MGFFDAIKLQTTVGYMYAGENGPALATHALCAAVLQNLNATNAQNPSLREIAEFVRATAERYMRNWGERWSDHWKFTAFIFGWCHVNQRLETYQLVPSLQERIEVRCQLVDTSSPVSIGSGATEFFAKLEELRTEGDEWGRTDRLPLIAVEQSPKKLAAISTASSGTRAWRCRMNLTSEIKASLAERCRSAS